MIDLTEEQIKKLGSDTELLSNVGTMSDSDFESKMKDLGISGSTEDMKAFKSQLSLTMSKGGKLTDEELNSVSAAGVKWKNVAKVLGSTIVTAGIIGGAIVGGRHWYKKKKSSKENNSGKEKKPQSDAPQLVDPDPEDIY